MEYEDVVEKRQNVWRKRGDEELGNIGIVAKIHTICGEKSEKKAEEKRGPLRKSTEFVEKKGETKADKS